MAAIPAWASGQAYTVGQQVIHESVTFQCISNHTSAPTNEPDAVEDVNWRTFWTSVTPMWGDWLYARIPAWMRSLDLAGGLPLYRFLRVFGRSFNQTQADINAFPLLKDISNVPAAYLDSYAYTLGMLLPHAVDEATQRRLLAAIVSLYRQKGVLKAFQFIVQRYLGLSVTITKEDFQAHVYVATYDDSGIPVGDRPATKAEINRILTLYEPAGLVHLIRGASEPVGLGTLNVEGFLNVSFELNAIFS